MRYVPCGDIVERAAQENDYESRLNWLLQHGASYREVPGGINKLFRDAFLRYDSSQKLNWMIGNGACPRALANIPMDFLSQPILSPLQGPRSEESVRWRRRLLLSSKTPLDVRWRRRLLLHSTTPQERPLKRQRF